MKTTGVIEGFFGPQWPEDGRTSFAPFLSQYGGDFYIYAPKQDPHLRKKWREPWDEDYLKRIKSYVDHFHAHKIKFGVGFSPFGLGETLTESDKKHLEAKLNILNELGIDLLGLFFDDMPTNENLAKTQVEAVKVIQQSFKYKIVFCPSYYTPDPILDKVFGQRPPNYLEDLASGISADVSMAWTGPKVISPVIEAEHLREVSQLLKRKPFIWENLYANDGPKNCKFLKLKPFTGRNQETFLEAEAFGLNLMNQAELSKILYLSSVLVLEGRSPDDGFREALKRLCSEPFQAFIERYRETLLSTGLDLIDQETKSRMIKELQSEGSPFSLEILRWLDGEYNVGSECLTD